MSNSIWKKPTVRPVQDCIVVWQNPAHMSFTLPRTARKDMEMYNCERWATLDDLIAQADKAERLQKAVDLAVDALKRIKEPTAWGSLYQEQEIATEALETIGKHKEQIC